MDARRRVFATVLGLLLLSVPASSLFLRDIIHFYSDFNSLQSQGPGPGGNDTIFAFGGEIAFEGPPGVFDLDLSGPDGVLTIGENAMPLNASMVVELEEPTHENVVEIGFDLTMLGGPSPLVVALSDDDGGGMIDMVFEDDGSVTIGSANMELDGALGSSVHEMHVLIVLRQALLGVKTWDVVITGPNGSQSLGGVAGTVGPLSLSEFRVVRPGLARSGSWTLDDLVISSPKTGGVNSSQ
jgi:hypothetical protein